MWDKEGDSTSAAMGPRTPLLQLEDKAPPALQNPELLEETQGPPGKPLSTCQKQTYWVQSKTIA